MNRQGFKKIKIILGEIEYYFFRLPSCALRRVDRAYSEIKGFSMKWVEEGRREGVRKNLKSLFGEKMDEEGIDGLLQEYFGILCCDDLDAWLWLLKSRKKIKRYIRVENGEYFREVTDKKKGCILLSAHFGGGFFLFDVAKELGGKPQGFGQPIKLEFFKGHFFRWLYFKFRLFCVKRAIGEDIIYTGRRETRREILEKLERGYHMIVLFDIPPYLTKGKTEKVNLMGRDWNFARGFLRMMAGTGIPIVPVFTFLAEDHTRTFRFYPSYQIENREGVRKALYECAKIFESHLSERPGQWFFWDGAEVFW